MEQVPRGSGTIELAVVLRFVDIAVDALAEAREEIDALNVYPVPDGDTGTNMYLTVVAARDALREATEDDGDLLVGLAALRKGALLGARGNSGVILSQMLGALATTIATAPAEERNASIMARALREATDGAVRRRGHARRGHHPDRGAGGRRGRRGPRSRSRAPAPVTSSPWRPPPLARPWRGRRSSWPCCATQAWSTLAAAGSA